MSTISIGEPTTLYRLLKVVADAGHTTLVIDDVAVDYELRQFCGFGLNDPIVFAEKNSDD